MEPFRPVLLVLLVLSATATFSSPVIDIVGFLDIIMAHTPHKATYERVRQEVEKKSDDLLRTIPFVGQAVDMKEGLKTFLNSTFSVQKAPKTEVSDKNVSTTNSTSDTDMEEYLYSD
jgi:hypothetical protein